MLYLNFHYNNITSSNYSDNDKYCILTATTFTIMTMNSTITFNEHYVLGFFLQPHLLYW